MEGFSHAMELRGKGAQNDGRCHSGLSVQQPLRLGIRAHPRFGITMRWEAGSTFNGTPWGISNAVERSPRPCPDPVAEEFL